MKNIFLFLILALHLNGWSYTCPQVLKSDVQAQRVFRWLNQLKGSFDLANCKVEITACDPLELGPRNPYIGEIYLVEQSGREAYLPVTVVTAEDSKMKTVVEESKRILNYLKVDH